MRRQATGNGFETGLREADNILLPQMTKGSFRPVKTNLQGTIPLFCFVWVNSLHFLTQAHLQARRKMQFLERTKNNISYSQVKIKKSDIPIFHLLCKIWEQRGAYIAVQLFMDFNVVLALILQLHVGKCSRRRAVTARQFQVCIFTKQLPPSIVSLFTFSKVAVAV